MERQTQYGPVGIGIVVHGNEIREFPHNGNTFVWANPGSEYSIVGWNFTNRRVEVVITVDGLDILTGKTGDYKTQRGYVINAGTKPRPIPGFRLDNQSVARFTFGAPEGSYAALTDRPNNIGVIGAAFFAERPRPTFRGDFPFNLNETRRYRGGGLESLSFNSTTKSAGASVGTEFGKRTDFGTTETSFIRESPNTPLAVLALHYHTKTRLREFGIDVDRPAPQIANPFPGAAGDGCAPPAGWKG